MATLHDARVGRYLIGAVAGRGGMGVVYRARDPELDRTVALKVIAPELARDGAFRARFVRESRLTAGLDHPNVIPVFEAGEDEHRLFIAMRFVDGTDLGRLIAQRGALDPALAAELVAQAASALDAAHARGLVHRDVKPANLLIAGLDRRPHVYLTDFGLAKRDGSTALTTTGDWIGTPDYASPEQIEGRELDARSDVYALGCVLFAALAGRPPFAAVPRMRKGEAQLYEPPPRLRDVAPGVPQAFDAVLARALAKDPADRHGSAGELGEAALAAAAADRGRGADGRRTPVVRRRRGTAKTAQLVERHRRSRPTLTAIVAGALIGVAAAAVALAAALGAFSTSPPKHAPARPRVARPAPPPAADPARGTVRCSATACIQDGRVVQAPIESGSCETGTGPGSWTRIDAGSPPLLACKPDNGPPNGRAAAAMPVPDLEGARLDHAQDLLDRLGIQHDYSGGGILGVIDAGNWQVCATRPAAGAAVSPAQKVKLFVDRSC